MSGRKISPVCVCRQQVLMWGEKRGGRKDRMKKG